MKIFTTLGLVIILFTQINFGQTILSRWEFEAVTLDTARSSTPILTAGNVFADNGLLTTGSAFSAYHSINVAQWSTPVGNGSTKSLSANNWSVNDYFQFAFSTVGYSEITITWDQTGSNTGPRDFKVQYSTDGTNFIDASGINSTYSLKNDSWSSSTSKPVSTRTLDLSSVSDFGNKSMVYIRLVNTSTVSINGETVASAGTNRVDNFTVLEKVIPQQNILLEENFDYGVNNDTSLVTITSNWTRHSGSMGPAYSSSSLTYTNYASSGIGGSVTFLNGSSGSNDGDIHRIFNEVTTTNNIYVSFLLNLSSALNDSDYFFHLGPSPIGTTFRGRVFATTNSSGWSIGLSKFTETRTFDNTILNFNQTYLVVLKYSFNTLANDDDLVTLYVYDSGLPVTEPGTPLVTIGPLGSGTGSDPSKIGSVAIRQGTNTPTGKIDGIRVATEWSNAPLPVELSSFSASVVGNTVKLNWRTETEINNYGFEVERTSPRPSPYEGEGGEAGRGWEKIGFVNGNGNSNSPKSYSFEDKNVTAGKYSYRLKQIDNDGQFEYSKTIEVDFGAPKKFELSQNYPNPFNPVTTIRFNLPEAGNVKLTLFNILGQEIKTLVNEFKESGVHTINFDASELNSGMYLYRIAIHSDKTEAGTFVQTRKMTLVK